MFVCFATFLPLEPRWWPPAASGTDCLPLGSGRAPAIAFRGGKRSTNAGKSEEGRKTNNEFSFVVVIFREFVVKEVCGNMKRNCYPEFRRIRSYEIVKRHLFMIWYFEFLIHITLAPWKTITKFS